MPSETQDLDAVVIGAGPGGYVAGIRLAQLKKKVLRFLDQKEIKQLYHRVEKDGDNWGRLFVHFKFESSQGKGRRGR